MLAQEAVNTALQLAIVLVLSLPLWLISGRRTGGFLSWIGLSAPTAAGMARAVAWFLVVGALSSAIYLHPAMVEAATADNTVAGKIRREGLSAEIIAVILMVAGIKTALSEEIFFRGLIGKRLINAFGFAAGNLLQAVLFGAIHLLIFVIPGGPAFDPMLGALFFGLPGFAGWMMGYVNHRDGRGSIFPGWLMHALGNGIAYPVMAFLA